MRRLIALTFVVVLAVPVLGAQGPGGPGAQGGRGPQVKVADAKPGETRLIVSNGVRVPLEAVKEQAQQAVGHPFVIEYGASQALRSTMESGQAFELAIVTPEVLEDMIKAGKVVPGSRVDVAQVPVSIGQIGEAPKADISTPAALKAALLKAKSVRWATNGASLPTINKMVDALGIRKELEAKLNVPRDQVQLAAGDYELNINLASEILPVRTQVYLGPIPSDFQVPAVMAAGIGMVGDQQAAKALIAFLKGSAINAALSANGMQRGDQPATAQSATPQGGGQGRPPAFKTNVLKDGRVYWVEGGGGNSGVIIGQNGVIVVDAKTTPDGAKQLIAEVAKLTPKPITNVILTHSDGDHVNGLPAFPPGVNIIAHVNNRAEQRATFLYGAVEVDGGRCLPPADRLPTQVVTRGTVTTKIEGVNLALYHFAPAHTSGDLVVYMPDEKIAFAGDLITNNVLVHTEKSGSLEGWFTSAKGLLGLNADAYVGGHANAVDTKATLQKRIDDYQAQRDKVEGLMKEGKSLPDIKTAMGDPAKNPSGCRGIPYLSLAEVSYQAQLDKTHELK